MHFIKDTTWEEVFEGMREREASFPGWIECATKVKGWPDWESWRRFTMSRISPENLAWEIFEFDDPMVEIPEMLLGPYGGWQSRVPNKNTSSFADMMAIPEQLEYWGNHPRVNSMIEKFPGPTEFIGVIREDLNKIVCLEGHHRATAVTLARMTKRSINVNNGVTIALASIPEEESVTLFDEMLKRGTAKSSENNPVI